MTESRAPVFGRRGMVVSGHPLASRAGWSMLDRGGSVADAAIAAAAVLTVVLPQACTLGGDVFLLIHDGGITRGLNASGPAPEGAHPTLFSGGIPQTGPLTATVPGLVGGWHEAHHRFGRLPWRDLLAPAIAIADDGFAVSRGVARAAAQYRRLLEADPTLAALFLPGGKPLAAGDLLRQPALAETLRGIAGGGADAFYRGRAAESLSRTCELRGGLLRRADFQRYRPDWVEPLETRYRGVTVRVMPPNSFGLLLLLQLSVLEGFDLSSLPAGSASRYSLLMRAAGAAFHEGRRAIADPACNPLPVAALLSREATGRMRAAAGATPVADDLPNQGGTAIVSAADAAGNGVTLVQSVFLPFGSGIADSETGVLLNNRMIGFTTDPGDPNCVGPSKRPAHTLCPAMALQEERLRFLLGSPGGPGQTLTLAQVLSNLLDLDMDVSEAVEAPRWSMDLEGNAILEASVAEETLAQLRRLGHRVERGAPGSPYFGSAEVIEVLPGGALCAAADWRRDAAAVGA